ncbi:hypothetical protein TR13x_02760 [Caloranaerobacter sp. TR13]|uniref:DUF116 domain-containing protein n=1 Tax=Caloranaerobacter sp. TR13 TaxID=1302151 RepID=UPI0006D3D7A1|nr:DUF116 domain-containing protein [Caloranaerobacter sp. TR13]KPU28273.1 hypothetical protein TR13x_02760 [Caloranaerobacter sp. TR13]
MKKDKFSFISTLSILFITLLLIIYFGIYLAFNNSIDISRIVLLVISIVLIFFTINILVGILLIYILTTGRNLSNISYLYLKKMNKTLFPVLVFIAKIFKLDKDSIRRVFADINNLLVKSKNINIDNSGDILILIPHCLQSSDCKHKITHDINNCTMCGRCDISEILRLSKEYNVKTVVATGGTLAREWIKKNRPKAIIAVACERDLASGINDVRKIPVIGVINERPNGPCFDTRVNIKKLEEAIILYLKEG